MTAKTDAERQRTARAKKKAAGFKQIEVWTPPEGVEQIQALAAKLREDSK